MSQIVILEPTEEFCIPENCFAIVETEEGKKLVTGVIKGSEVQRLTLIPKVAGG